MNRRYMLGLMALALSGTVAALATAGATAALSCGAPGSHTLVHRGDLRIYSLSNAVYACSTRYGLHVRLETGVSSIDLYKRAGPSTLAYAIVNRFGSRSLSTGRRLRRFVSTQFGQFYERPDALVVRRDGSIAYIYTGNFGDTHSESNVVGKDDKTGKATLDSDCVLCSNHIDVTSLRVVGATVHWTDSGMDMSAPFQ